MSNFRELQREKRVQRTAKRIQAAGGLSKMTFPSMDAAVSPGQGGAWVVPEPSPETLAHFNSHGIAVSDEDAGARRARPVDGMPPVPAASAPNVSFADAVAEGVRKTLAAMGIKPPLPDTGAPPVNEDR
jgi:hypothetical protein